MRKVEQYYTTESYFRQRLHTIGRRLGLRDETLADHACWKAELRATLVRLAGIDTMVPTPLIPRITESVVVEDGIVRERVLLETEPDVTMPCYVLRPAHSVDGALPVVLCPHGHRSGGKLAPAGRRDIPEVSQTIEVHQYDYALQYARCGFVAIAPDARGFGERRESTRQGDSSDLVLGGSCAQLNAMAIPLGQTVAGMWTWDLMRLIDYVAMRPDCDSQRVGCAGLSGGGMQTLWLTALDERVKAAVVSGYLYGCEESLLVLSGNCQCNYVPHLWEHADIGDIAALIAPRPLLVETGTRDELNGQSGMANVAAQMEIIRRAYVLHDMADRLHHDVFEGGHRWNGMHALPWMQRWL